MHRSSNAPVTTRADAPARPAFAASAPRTSRIVRAPGPEGLNRFASVVGAVLIFLAISRFHLYIRPLAVIRVQLLLIALSAVLLLAQTSSWHPRDLARHWIGRMIGFIFAVALVGAPFALNDGRALTFALTGFLPTLVIGMVSFAMARTPKGSFLVARSIVAGGVTAAALALVRGSVDPSGRLSGAFTYDSNDLALIVVLTIPLIVWWALEPANRLRLLLLGTLPMLLHVLLRTGSRGGLLALAATVMGFLVVSRSGVAPRLRKASLLAVFLAVAAIPLLPGTLVERMMALVNYEDDYNATSENGRLQIWRRGMGYAFTHPLTGVGINNFPVAEGTISDVLIDREADKGVKWSVAHNSFVHLAAELGLFAGVTFIVLLIRTIRALFRSHRVDRRLPNSRAPDLLAPLLAISFVGYAVGGFFLSMAYADILYVMYGLAAALLVRAGSPVEAPAPPRTSTRVANGRVRVAQ